MNASPAYRDLLLQARGLLSLAEILLQELDVDLFETTVSVRAGDRIVASISAEEVIARIRAAIAAAQVEVEPVDAVGSNP